MLPVTGLRFSISRRGGDSKNSEKKFRRKIQRKNSEKKFREKFRTPITF
jgi:hypothetical protein